MHDTCMFVFVFKCYRNMQMFYNLKSEYHSYMYAKSNTEPFQMYMHLQISTKMNYFDFYETLQGTSWLKEVSISKINFSIRSSDGRDLKEKSTPLFIAIL